MVPDGVIVAGAVGLDSGAVVVPVEVPGAGLAGTVERLGMMVELPGVVVVERPGLTVVLPGIVVERLGLMVGLTGVVVGRVPGAV